MDYGTLHHDTKNPDLVGGPTSMGSSQPLLSESQRRQQQQQQIASAAAAQRRWSVLKSSMVAAQKQGTTTNPKRPVLKQIFEKKKSRRHMNHNTNNDDDNHHQQQDEVPQPAGGGGVMNIDTAPTPLATRNKKKSFVFTMLNPRSTAIQAVIFKWFITIVILVDLIGFVISTEPNLDDDTVEMFDTWEGVTSTIFLIELILRLITVTESTKYGSMGWFWGRLKWCCTSAAMIDIVATLPFFVELISGWDLPTLTYLRSFRLIRILKTSGFAAATNAVYRVIYYNRQILYVAMLICIGLVLFTAVLMYYLRPQGNNGQYDDTGFESLGSTMYLATLMLTGQGGPDNDNLPWYTKGVVLLTGVFSIGMFAIPASMLTWGFEAEAERCARESYKVPKRHDGTNGGFDDDCESDTWSFSSDDYSTDEEYKKIITGGDDDDDEDDPDAEAIADFRLADIDGSGNISLSEFLALSRLQQQQQQSAALASAGGSGSPAAAVSGGGGGGVNDLESRVVRMEQQIQANSQKLDKICGILETLQRQNRK